MSLPSDNAVDVVDSGQTVLHDPAAVGPERFAEKLRRHITRADHVIVAMMHLHQLSGFFRGASLLADSLPAELLDCSESMPHLHHLSAFPMRDHACRYAISI